MVSCRIDKITRMFELRPEAIWHAFPASGRRGHNTAKMELGMEQALDDNVPPQDNIQAHHLEVLHLLRHSRMISSSVLKPDEAHGTGDSSRFCISDRLRLVGAVTNKFYRQP